MNLEAASGRRFLWRHQAIDLSRQMKGPARFCEDLENRKFGVDKSD
jgi:hypothetical protein